jgi:hypothetical protein
LTKDIKAVRVKALINNKNMEIINRTVHIDIDKLIAMRRHMTGKTNFSAWVRERMDEYIDKHNLQVDNLNQEQN